MKKVIGVAVTISFVASLGTFGAESGPSLKQTLGKIPAAEMPERAADLVKKASERDREALTVEIIRVSIARNPGVGPTLVGTIARAVPDMAPIAAAAAATEQPKIAAEISKAAAKAAPGQAGKIVSAVCGAVPTRYREVAIAVAEANPGASKEILRAVAGALPELKAWIEKAMETWGQNPLSVAAVLNSPAIVAARNGKMNTGGDAISAGPPPLGPSLAPPYVPRAGASSTITPADTHPVPRGRRNYAAP